MSEPPQVADATLDRLDRVARRLEDLTDRLAEMLDAEEQDDTDGTEDGDG